MPDAAEPPETRLLVLLEEAYALYKQSNLPPQFGIQIGKDLSSALAVAQLAAAFEERRRKARAAGA